jgi:Cu(I)/Ag(I) efflux system membrane fusion protein
MMKKILKQYKLVLASLMIGLLAGWILFHSGGNRSVNNSANGHDQELAEGTMWTCSMHPQIKQDKPGLCPICAMDLIPMESGGSDEEGVDPNEVSMTPSAAKLAAIQTIITESNVPEQIIHLQGKVTEDERNTADVTARFGGRIEELYVNFTGQEVLKGQKLATIYSPELLSAQKELIVAMGTKDKRPTLYEAARMKLLYWNLTEDQISRIEKEGKPFSKIDILSPISGTVSMRYVDLGDYVNEGTELFKVIDLSRVWIQMDGYESDLPWIRLNDKVTFGLRAVPGKKYEGKIDFIDPVINPQTRVAQLRMNVPNSKGELKPGMFVSALLKASLHGKQNMLLIPKTAVLWTGKRSLVYVAVPDREDPSFLMREIVLGAEAGDKYVIEEGLVDGEEIVVNGVFKIDAAAQLRGLKSMMNESGTMPNHGHNHGEMLASEEGDMEKNMPDETHLQDTLAKEIMHYEVDPLFKLQLTDLYNAYLPMKDAFVLSHARKVRKAGKKLIPFLDAIDMQYLDGDALIEWKEQLSTMKGAMDKILLTKDIEMQRAAFSDFNGGFHNAVKSFGLHEKIVYYQFCPMAFNDKGAYWLSNEEQIANPYFGDVMLRCGEVQDIIEH